MRKYRLPDSRQDGISPQGDGTARATCKLSINLISGECDNLA
ncbi:Uncharacterised protein [Serratia fonticola]|nr:hypothetical protein [Serratia fonticola]CAI2034280.1 Uncharacterised protein [Serratia fonticola]